MSAHFFFFFFLALILSERRPANSSFKVLRTDSRGQKQIYYLTIGNCPVVSGRVSFIIVKEFFFSFFALGLVGSFSCGWTSLPMIFACEVFIACLFSLSLVFTGILVENDRGWGLFWWCWYSHPPAVEDVLLIMAGIESNSEIRTPGGRHIILLLYLLLLESLREVAIMKDQPTDSSHFSIQTRQNDAFSSCVLQVWQHWPLRWSVIT